MWGYSRKTYGRKYYYGGKRYRRSGNIARAYGTARAAKRGDKSENLNITTQGYFNFTYGTTNPPLSNVVVFTPYMGGLIPATGQPNDATNPCYGAAVNDRTFRLKCSQYDEVRLDSMRVYINPQVSSSSSTTPQMTISTIWDRKTSPKEAGVVGNNANWIEGRLPTALEVITNEGAQKTPVNMNSTRGAFRSIQARNMQEKSTFWDSTIHYDTTQGDSPLENLYLSSWEVKDGAFCPTLYAVSQLNMTQVFGQSFVCAYRVEYNFTFRNPKSELTDFLSKEAPGTVNRAIADPNRSLHEDQSSLIAWMREYKRQKEAATTLLRGERSVQPAITYQTTVITKKEDDDDDKMDDTTIVETTLEK